MRWYILYVSIYLLHGITIYFLLYYICDICRQLFSKLLVGFQAALRTAGLPAPEQIVTADVAEARRFARRWAQVVVKPRASSGGDGVWLCREEETMYDIYTRIYELKGKTI